MFVFFFNKLFITFKMDTVRSYSALVCPNIRGEHRALPSDIEALSTTLKMKLGSESVPVYSYGFSGVCEQ